MNVEQIKAYIVEYIKERIKRRPKNPKIGRLRTSLTAFIFATHKSLLIIIFYYFNLVNL